MRTRTIAELIVGITVLIAMSVMGYLLWNARRKRAVVMKRPVIMVTKTPIYPVSTMPPKVTTTAPPKMVVTQYPSPSWTLGPPAWVASNTLPPSGPGMLM